MQHERPKLEPIDSTFKDVNEAAKKNQKTSASSKDDNNQRKSMKDSCLKIDGSRMGFIELQDNPHIKDFGQNDVIKNQLLYDPDKDPTMEKFVLAENPFGNEKERLQNRLNEIKQSILDLKNNAKRTKKFNEDKKDHLEYIRNTTNASDFEELHALTVEKKRRITELEKKIFYKEKEKLTQQKDYYDEVNKVVYLKNVLLNELKEMIKVAQNVPSFKEGDNYFDPTELVKVNYLLNEGSREEGAYDYIPTAEPINPTHYMPSGLASDNNMLGLLMNTTAKQYSNMIKNNSLNAFDMNNNEGLTINLKDEENKKSKGNIFGFNKNDNEDLLSEEGAAQFGGGQNDMNSFKQFNTNKTYDNIKNKSKTIGSDKDKRMNHEDSKLSAKGTYRIRPRIPRNDNDNVDITTNKKTILLRDLSVD